MCTIQKIICGLLIFGLFGCGDKKGSVSGPSPRKANAPQVTADLDREPLALLTGFWQGTTSGNLIEITSEYLESEDRFVTSVRGMDLVALGFKDALVPETANSNFAYDEVKYDFVVLNKTPMGAAGVNKTITARGEVKELAVKIFFADSQHNSLTLAVGDETAAVEKYARQPIRAGAQRFRERAKKWNLELAQFYKRNSINKQGCEGELQSLIHKNELLCIQFLIKNNELDYAYWDIAAAKRALRDIAQMFNSSLVQNIEFADGSRGKYFSLDDQMIETARVILEQIPAKIIAELIEQGDERLALILRSAIGKTSAAQLFEDIEKRITKKYFLQMLTAEPMREFLPEAILFYGRSQDKLTTAQYIEAALRRGLLSTTKFKDTEAEVKSLLLENGDSALVEIFNRYGLNFSGVGSPVLLRRINELAASSELLLTPYQRRQELEWQIDDLYKLYYP